MIAETLHHRPFVLTAAGILLGAALIATGSIPLAVVGAALIVAGLLVPLIRFGTQATAMTEAAPLAMVVRDLVQPETSAAKFSVSGLSWFVVKTFGPPLGSEDTAETLLHRWEDEIRREGFLMPETLAAAGKLSADQYRTWSAGSLHDALLDDRAFYSLLQSLAPGTSVIVAVRKAEAASPESVDQEGTDDVLHSHSLHPDVERIRP